MPANLYGPGDNYDLQNFHVLPALIRKMQEAKIHRDDFVSVWGTGTLRREFLYSDDLADACIFLMSLPDSEIDGVIVQEKAPALINIGCGEDLAIRVLAELVKHSVGFGGELVFDTTKPDGTPRKLLDVSRIRALGWKHKTNLTDGIRAAYADYIGRNMA